MLPDANFLSSWCQSPSSRAQNRGFCAFLAFGIPVFRLFEHKIGVFVRFWGLEPPFSGISSTKSRFLCAFGFRDPRFRAFRAQNRGFCALLGFGTPIFGHFEHKNPDFVLGRAFVFWEWWVLSCILTFVVCLSNFYELFLLKLLLRVCWSVATGAYLPQRCCREVVAVE